MISAKMTMSTVILITTTLIAGVVPASLDNIQTPFSGVSSQDGNLRGVPVRRARSTGGQPIQLCGRRLLEGVQLVCAGTVFSAYTRRSDPAMPIGGGMMEELRDSGSTSMDLENNPQYSSGDILGDGSTSDYPDMDNNWSRNPKALGLKMLAEGKSHPRFRRNIIEECCKKPCTTNHMLKYCGRR